MKLITIFSFCAGGLLLSMSCAKNSTTALIEDDSASGAIAAAVGGALSNSISSGSLSLNKTPEFFNPTISRELASFVPPSLASNACPTFASTDAGCTHGGSSQWLSYRECIFANSPATWTGTQLLKTSSGAATCGNLPNPGPSGSLLRQFVAGTSSLTPASAIRTAASGGVITLDDAT
ncbi:MAG: hypothetical protein H7333_00900, partial [Bdellovibrionales bacterium]|nr:hypothetical protein [Oligoflexia bacterium]